MSIEQVNNNQDNQRKRGRPRREVAKVVAGDLIIDSLMSECGMLEVDGRKVSVEGAREVKLLDVLEESDERASMLEEEVMSRDVYRRERDLKKKADREKEREELKEAKKRERDALCEKKKAEKAQAKEDAKAAKEEAKAAKAAARVAERESLKAEKVATKEAAKAEKVAAKEAAKAVKVAAKEAAKAAKVAAKEAAKEAAKAEKAANKKNSGSKSKSKSKKVAHQLITAVRCASASESESASQCEENGELVPQEFLTESGDSSAPWDTWKVPMMMQPSTGYEAPVRSGDSFCDP